KTHIDILINDNFFIIPLDGNNYNYRFHHLIQRHLYNQSLSNWGHDKISSIHCMSAEWYKNHNQPSLAIEHFIKGNNFENALGLFKVYRLQLLREMDWSSLKHIVNLFPKSYAKTSAEIQLSKAWLLIYSGDVFEMFSMLGYINEIICADESRSKALIAELKSLQVYELYNLSKDYDQCVEACSFAIKHLPKEHVYALGYAWIFLGAAMQITHSTTIAVQKIKQGITEDNDLRVKSHQWLVICYLYWMSGENEKLIRSSQSLIELGLQSNNLEALANGYYFKGMAQFAHGDINKAKKSLLEFYELRYSTIAVIHFMAMTVLSKCLFVLGEDARLNSVLDKMAEMIHSQRDAHFGQLLEILKADFYLSKGHKKLAISQVNKLGDVALTALSDFYNPQIAMARILLMSNSASDLNYAKSLISKLEEVITRTKNGRFIVDLLLLKSESALRTADQAFAEQYAEKAIRIANTRRYISPFLEISDELVEIVESVSKLKFSDFYKPLKRLLNNLNSENTPQLLSNRELEVLKLLRKNLTNKQIAIALYISEKTVKRHCSNLFKKLGVKNRREATIKFQSLDLAHQI
ncbi:MAG: LuxR C-terminal-related transcriptional regulator, partial [Flavobacteriaceae bacterium]